MATEVTATAAATGICDFVDAFLVDLNTAIQESARGVTGVVENDLHQKLQSCGDKKKQARQLNAVAKGSSAYMARVQSAFMKNFDKFELYMRRNIISIPADVADAVQELHTKRTQGNETSKDGSEQSSAGDASLTPSQRRENQLEAELRELHKQVRELELDSQRMTLEHKALETKVEQFQQVASKLDFLDQFPVTTVSPLKRTAEQVAALQQSLQAMDGVQSSLEDDTRTFKRQKMETRDTYLNVPILTETVGNHAVAGNLRQRFLARTSTVAFATLEDLKQLNSNLTAAM